MSVIVMGMDMPASCASCRMAVCFLDTGRAKCYATLSYIDPERGKRSYDCPLRPLPEKHGMLIDADKAIENIMIRQRALKDSTGNVDSGLFTRDIEICIKEQPTLSPADVKPVVTCGKCKYGKYTGASWFCDKHSGHADKFGEDASYHEYHSKYWFCADGEEKNHA